MRLINLLFGRGSPSAIASAANPIEPSADVASLRARVVALEGELRIAHEQRQELMGVFMMIASGELYRRFADEKPGPPTARERMAIANAMKIQRERERNQA